MMLLALFSMSMRALKLQMRLQRCTCLEEVAVVLAVQAQDGLRKLGSLWFCSECAGVGR